MSLLQLKVSFCLTENFSFMSLHLLIVDISVYIISGLFRKLSPMLVCSRPCLVLYWGLWPTWTWVLCRVIETYLFEFFYMSIFSLISTILKIFSLYMSDYFIKNLVPKRCEACLRFNSINRPVCFYTKIMLFILENRLKSGTMIFPEDLSLYRKDYF